MPDDDIKITEEETPQVSPDEVLQFVNDNLPGQDAQQDTTAPSPGQDESDTASPVSSGDLNAQDQTSFYFSADETFSSSNVDDVDKELFVDVDKTKIEITREDKTMYLKAVLNDVPVRLDIPVAGQRILVSCRALTAQEKLLVPIGCLEYIGKHPSYPLASFATLIQMARVAMQVTAIDSRPIAYLELSDPLKNLEEESKNLIPAVLDKVQNMSSSRYNFFTKALNVFENKLARLSDAAFDQDFWDPAVTD